MPAYFDPSQLLSTVSALSQTSVSGESGLRSGQLAAIEVVLRETHGHASVVGILGEGPRKQGRDDPLDIYLKQFGLIETLECLSISPDLLGWTWEEVEERFEMIEHLLLAMKVARFN